jgi:predicted nucleic acid-binding protein
MKSLKSSPNKISIDSSVILSYYLGEELGEKAKILLFQKLELKFYITLNGLTEIFYILCRTLGFQTAKNKLDTLINTNILQIESSTELISFAGSYKCTRAISLSDSFVIGLAKFIKGAAIFVKKEAELDREINKAPFDVQLFFLKDLNIENLIEE